MVGNGNGFSCVLIGSKSLLIQCAEIVQQKQHSIRAIVSRDDAIVRWAGDHGIPVVAPGRDLARGLAGFEFDYLFSITNLSLIPDEVLDLPARGAINFHDGPLPRYAGLYTPVWALKNREPEYGITFHLMTSGVDEGDILKQRLFEVSPAETSLTINARCYGEAIEAFSELMDELASGTEQPVAQDLERKSYFGKWDRPEAACVLDWSRSADEVAALVRALDFGRYENPVGSPKLVHGDAVLLAGGVAVLEEAEDAAPGTLLAADSEGLEIRTGEGAVRLFGLRGVWGAELEGEPAAALGVAVGDVLAGPDAGLRDRLGGANEQLCRAEAFWVRRLRVLESVSLPYLRTDAPTDGVAAGSEPLRLGLEVPGDFRQVAAGREMPAGDALAAAFGLYLLRASGHERGHVGFRDASVAAAGEGIEAFVSARVPLGFAMGDPEQTVADALDEVAGELAKIRKRGTFLRDAIARHPELADQPDLVAGRLLPVAFEQVDEVGAAGLADGVSFALVTDAEGHEAQLVFDPATVDAADAEAVRDQLAALLSGMSNGSARVVQLSLLSEEERDRLASWNATEAEIPRDATIVDLFEAQVARTPDAEAVVFEGDSLTYAELDARANQLAAHLRELGVGPDRLVGVFLDRSLDMIVSIFGVMKAGGAYIPLDPAYPSDRIAFMIEDSRVSVVLTQSGRRNELPPSDARVIAVDSEWSHISNRSPQGVACAAAPENLAYVIYTSGSTGKPKGVMVEHRNVVNFFVGMDERIPHDPPGVWLAVTSLSFDISVLELHWTLCRGFKVVLFADSAKAEPRSTGSVEEWREVDFGLFLWGADGGAGPKKYELMLDAARFADTHGFTSISTPERHFHAFGGPYPNPSVTSAAIAAVTENVQIRAGSCVVPLHHPIRVAEEWAVVDNISNGRVAIAFAAGWQPNDFVIRKEGFENAKAKMMESIDVVHRLWKGESVAFENPLGQMHSVVTQPRPIQRELPTWITTAGNVETYELAGRNGANVLTHLLGQTVEEVAEKVAAYRRAREEAGLDPAEGTVTLMLHTFVGHDDDTVRELVREPMKNYLASSVSLVKDYAWAFPAFKRPGGKDATPADIDLNSLSEEEMDAILEFAFERYFETSGLFGCPETCARMVDRVRGADIDEIACLIDYGVPTDQVVRSLKLLDQVRIEASQQPSADGDYSLAAQVAAHGVTHMQCTPSMAKMMTLNEEMRGALGRIRHLMIGGEAFPVSLAADLHGVVGGTVTNMYGPTETTIWSSTQPVAGKPESISIGRPIANTRLYIVDPNLQPVPVGVPGELLIGGDGVVRGYLERPELTDERFVPDPFGPPGARLYRTGDLARYAEDGSVDFLGRMDFQVKIRGYRIELGEIETHLGRLPAVRECVVVAREDTPGDLRLVAYVVPEGEAVAADDLRQALGARLPEFMVPSTFAMVESFPLTPNGKVDRKALPAPDQLQARPQVEYVAPEGELEQTLAGIWSDVLKIESIGMDDNFFDLGGHSLLVVQVHRQLRERIDRPVSLTDLYRFATIRTLAAYLKGENENEALEQSRERGEARRNAMQRRREMRGRGRRGRSSD